MINLIPTEERKKIHRSIYYKLTVLFLFLAGFSVFIFFIAILPAYFFSSVELNLANANLQSQKKEPAPAFDENTTLIIKDLNTKLALIESKQKNKFSVSEKVINAVIFKKMPEIKITKISYHINLAHKRAVDIGGTAPSREALLRFREALEEDTMFKEVDLPISNFIKGSNIQFDLNLIAS